MTMFEKYFSHCVEPLKGWYEQELIKVESLKELPENTILFGCACWGESYIKTFLEFSIPSLLASENLPHFTKKWKVIWIIHTSEENYHTIANHKSCAKLRNIGVELHIRIIPRDVFEMIINPIEKYWILGCAHNIYMQTAKKLGTAYHMVAPDLIYSNGFLKRLDELTQENDVVLHSNISCSKEGCEQELTGYFSSNGAIEIDYIDLCAIGLKNIHSRMECFLMNGKDFSSEMPNSACLFFFGEKYFHIYCPHYNLFYVSKNTIKKAPVLLFNTLDAEIAKFIQSDSRVYIINEKDRINVLELTSSYKIESESNNNGLPYFAASFWDAAHFDVRYLKYFAEGTRFAIPENFVSSYEPMDDAKITMVISALRDFIDENRMNVYDALPNEYKLKIEEINEVPEIKV